MERNKRSKKIESEWSYFLKLRFSCVLNKDIEFYKKNAINYNEEYTYIRLKVESGINENSISFFILCIR